MTGTDDIRDCKSLSPINSIMEGNPTKFNKYKQTSIPVAAEIDRLTVAYRTIASN